MNKELEGRLIYFVSLPEESVHFESDDEVKELQMTDCDHCHQWYHRSCLAVADYVFKQKKQIGFVLSVKNLCERNLLQ